jgi:hypothetical protein
MPTDESDRTPSEVAEEIQKFLDAMAPYELTRLSSPVSDIYLYLPDLQMLVAVIRAIANGETGAANREFLESADRAVSGWKAANRRQMASISRLMDKFQNVRFFLNDKKDATASGVREILDA